MLPAQGAAARCCAEVKELADALGARRDPDVELLALEQFAASVGPDERAGVQIFIDRTRIEQAEGNARLAAALEEARRTDLRGRLAELAEVARSHVAGGRGDAGRGARGRGAGSSTSRLVEAREHPHGLGRLNGPAPASANQDTGW